MYEGAPFFLFDLLLVASFGLTLPGPNAEFQLDPISWQLRLVASTANGVGIASRSEIVVSYGLQFDLQKKFCSGVETESDRKFRGALDRLFKETVDSTGSANPNPNPVPPKPTAPVPPVTPKPVPPQPLNPPPMPKPKAPELPKSAAIVVVPEVADPPVHPKPPAPIPKSAEPKPPPPAPQGMGNTAEKIADVDTPRAEFWLDGTSIIVKSLEEVNRKLPKYSCSCFLPDRKIHGVG